MYFFIARQEMTDMPFVGPMTAALCLGAVALIDQDVELPRRRVGRFDLPDSPWFYVFAALWLLVTVPQLVYNSIALRLVVPMGGRGRLILPGVVPMLPYIVMWGVFGWLILKAR